MLTVVEIVSSFSRGPSPVARPWKELRLCQRQWRRNRRRAAEEAELRGAVVLGERVRPRQPVHLARRPQDQPRADPRQERAADPRLGGARPQQHEAATGMMESLVVVVRKHLLISTLSLA